jgi:hypothetical protein
MFTAETSDSDWIKTPPASAILEDKYSMISVCGVIGYPAKNLHPALTAASANATLPFISFFATSAHPLLQNFKYDVGTDDIADTAYCTFIFVNRYKAHSLGVDAVREGKSFVRASADTVPAALASVFMNSKLHNMAPF